MSIRLRFKSRMALLLRKEGILTSIQGLGELGLQRYGINPRGAMDRFAARVANILVANPDDDQVLEAHFPAPEVEFTKDLRFAITGADFAAVLDGSPLPNWSANSALAGQVLTFQRLETGSRAYIAIEGGLELPISDPPDYSTRRLTKGTKLEQRRPPAGLSPRSRILLSPSMLPPYERSPSVRVVKGGEYYRLDRTSADIFATSAFTVTNDSNRMGYRLTGPSLATSDSGEMLSAAVTFGTVQLLPDGQLIVLMADHQTSGGYPRIANVITADLPLLAQLSPGDTVSFKLVGLNAAEAALRRIEMDIAKLRAAVDLRM